MKRDLSRTLSGMLFLALSLTVAAGQDETLPGQSEFVEYCAACHGVDGRGLGQQYLKTAKPPRDLSLLSQANRGTFPYVYVRRLIDGRVDRGGEASAHMKGGMPVWGNVFVSEKGHSAAGRMHGEAVAKMRILNIIDYLVAIQRQDESL